MSAHTEGRLCIGVQGGIEGAKSGTSIAYAFSRWVGAEEADANARRLVACWNALEGVPTEAIEALPADSLEHARRFVLRLAQSKGEPS